MCHEAAGHCMQRKAVNLAATGSLRAGAVYTGSDWESAPYIGSPTVSPYLRPSRVTCVRVWVGGSTDLLSILADGGVCVGGGALRAAVGLWALSLLQSAVFRRDTEWDM